MRALLLIAVLALAGCGEPELSPAEKARQDEADIAAVKATQVPPPSPVSPDVIGAPDIEKYDLYGAGCAFAPEQSIGAIALVDGTRGSMKIDGKLIPFAPDAGSGDLPLGAKGKYTAGGFSFTLDLAEEEGKQSGMETTDFPARFVLRNDRDQIVFESNGTAQCGS